MRLNILNIGMQELQYQRFGVGDNVPFFNIVLINLHERVNSCQYNFDYVSISKDLALEIVNTL